MDVRPYDSTFFYDSMGMRLWERRHQQLDQYIGIDRILDIGCNDGKFIERLSHATELELIVGLDIDEQALQQASENIKFDQIQDCLKSNRKQPCWIYLYKGDALKKYQELKQHNFTLITIVEVIEHLQLNVLGDLCENVFGYLNPEKIIITTPNSDFNIYFKEMDPNFVLRHPDHKYEFTQKQFTDWCQDVAGKYGYNTQYDGVGKHRNGELTYGYASQICIFTKMERNIKQLEPDNESLELVLKHICPFDPRSQTERFGDEIIANYSRFSLANSAELSDSEYELLQNFNYEQIIIRKADLPQPELIEELVNINSRFTFLQDDYILLNLE